MRLGPTREERRLVARALLTEGELIGSEDEIWTHPDALRALGTLRYCVDAIRMLVDNGNQVQASFIKSIVVQTDGLPAYPFFLDGMAEFLVKDHEARMYWASLMPDDFYPHRCPRCGAAAFVGFNLVDCKAGCHR